MKFMNSSFARTIASTTLLCLGLASASFAATKPLSYPEGLAVDSKGNLYVANYGGSDILVYNASYSQETSKTITANVVAPTGVAIDAQGNLWVANYGTSNGGQNGSIAEYTDGKQVTSASITNGILGPEALAVDGAGNVWVENDYVNITVYAPSSPFGWATTPVRTFAPTYPIYGLAVAANMVGWGSNAATYFAPATEGLVTGGLQTSYAWGNDTGFALAANAAGNVYMGNLNGSVNLNTPYVEYSFLQLSFTPTGIAVDNARERVYISNAVGNSISVYSTSGSLLKVIQ